MKKLFAFIITGALLAALLCVPVLADTNQFGDDFFPGGSIETPSRAPLIGAFDHYEDGTPDHTHINFFYFMTDDMLALCDELIRADQDGTDLLYGKYGLSSFDAYVQVDVKFNDGDWFSSRSNWNEREYPGEYCGRDLQLLFENDIYTGDVDQLRDFVQSWLTYHDGDNFLTPYIKKVKGNNGDVLWQFDLKDGSMTYRYRFVVEYDVEDDDEGLIRLFSGWSPETRIGKDGNMEEPVPVKTAAPVLSDFSMDVNSEGRVTATYYLTVPDSVFDNYLYYALRDEAFEMYGFEAQVRVNDGEWTDMDFEGPRSLWTGFRRATHEDIASIDDKVQIRVRLVSDKSEVGDSPWSNIVGNAVTEGEQIHQETNPDGSTDEPAPVKPEEDGKSECGLCHICPVQPLGICLFVWIALVLAVIIIIVLIIRKGKKRKQ